MKTILNTSKRLFLSIIDRSTKTPKDTFNDVINSKCNANCENCVCQINKQHFKL